MSSTTRCGRSSGCSRSRTLLSSPASNGSAISRGDWTAIHGRAGAGEQHAGFDEAGAGNANMGVGFGSKARAVEVSPNPTASALAPAPTPA